MDAWHVAAPKIRNIQFDLIKQYQQKHQFRWTVRYILVTSLSLTSYVTLDKTFNCFGSKFPFAYNDLFKLEAFQSSLQLPFSASFHQGQSISESSINQQLSTTTALFIDHS